MAKWDGVKRLFWQSAEEMEELGNRGSIETGAAPRSSLGVDFGPPASTGAYRSAASSGAAEVPLLPGASQEFLGGTATAITQSQPPSSSSSPYGPPSSSLVGLPPEVAIQRILGTLRDVDGILGSIVIGDAGTVIGRDLPTMFSDDVAAQLAGRLTQLHDALVLDGGELSTADMHFPEFRFHIGKMPTGLIGVLAQSNANSPALGMALSLVTRRVQKQLAAAF